MMISNDRIIDDIIKKYSSNLQSNTIISLIKHVLTTCGIDENVIDDDDVKTIFEPYSNIKANGHHPDFGKRGWKDESSSRKRKSDLYHMLFMLWVSSEDQELFSIREKMTKRVCFILKEIFKPSYLVPENSQSFFRQIKKNVSDNLYFIPTPFKKEYGGIPRYHDMDEITEKTKQMREHRDRMIRREEQKRELKVNTLPNDKTMDWRIKDDANREKKLQPVLRKRYESRSATSLGIAFGDSYENPSGFPRNFAPQSSYESHRRNYNRRY